MLDGGEPWEGADDLVVSLGLQVLVIDRRNHIRFITPAAAFLLRCQPPIVGRPATAMSEAGALFAVVDDVRLVLADKGEVRRTVVFDSGQRATRRSLPYRSAGAIQGVVITFEPVGIEPPPCSMPAVDPGSDVAALTTRQREVMALVVAGYPSKRIAAELGISARTVENHRSSIMRRTGCRSLPELTRFALRHGLRGNMAQPRDPPCHEDRWLCCGKSKPQMGADAC